MYIVEHAKLVYTALLVVDLVLPDNLQSCRKLDMGLDWDGPVPTDSDEHTVAVPNTQEILSPEGKQVIQETLDQLATI